MEIIKNKKTAFQLSIINEYVAKRTGAGHAFGEHTIMFSILGI
jgi:hypothetical protein